MLKGFFDKVQFINCEILREALKCKMLLKNVQVCLLFSLKILMCIKVRCYNIILYYSILYYYMQMLTSCWHKRY